MPIRVKGQTADRHPRREWNSPERRRERQKEYMDKHGERPPRRKRLTPGTSATQEHRKNLREKLKNLPKWKVQPKAVPAKKYDKGGSAKLTPAETRRKAGPSAARPVPKSLRDRLKDLTKKGSPSPSPGRPGGKGKESPDKRWNKGDKFMTPLRAKKAVGGVAKKGTHPKGKTESSLKQSKKHAKTKYGVKDAFKPNFYPVRNREFRSWRTKKAEGGRIGLKKGSVHKPGSHSWWLLQQSKPKRTKKAEGKRVGGGTAKKTYHDKTTLAKSQRHPHSRLKTQKEYKAITDSATYKKADYHTKNKMLKKHPTTMKKGGRAGYYGGGRTRLLEELGRVEAEPSNRNRRAEISRVHGELNKGYKSGGAVLKGKKVGIQIK